MSDPVPINVAKPPGYWMYETSGTLKPAIESFLRNPRTMTVRDVSLMKAYCCQWIDSPVWGLNPHNKHQWASQLAQLRKSAREIDSPVSLCVWIAEAEKHGVDPL